MGQRILSRLAYGLALPALFFLCTPSFAQLDPARDAKVLGGLEADMTARMDKLQSLMQSLSLMKGSYLSKCADPGFAAERQRLVDDYNAQLNALIESRRSYNEYREARSLVSIGLALQRDKLVGRKPGPLQGLDSADETLKLQERILFNDRVEDFRDRAQDDMKADAAAYDSGMGACRRDRRRRIVSWAAGLALAAVFAAGLWRHIASRPKPG